MLLLRAMATMQPTAECWKGCITYRRFQRSQEQASADILVIHPSGRFLYASGYGKTNSVAMWSIDTSSGALTPIQHMVDGLHFHRR